MKNKIGLYVFGELFVLSMSYIAGNVYASDCDYCYSDQRIVENNQQVACVYACEHGISTTPTSTVPAITELQQECKDGCCGIKLNTDFPGIGNCIELKRGGTGVNSTVVLPYMLGTLMKIIMNIIMVVCFILIIVSGILWAANKPDKAKSLVKKVAVAILLLGLSGVILKVINPLFFA